MRFADECGRAQGGECVQQAKTYQELSRELEAYKRAKAENDERFMLERDEARHRAERLRQALLLHVYEGELTTGCTICQCSWEPGAAEVHDADCIARPWAGAQ